MSKEMNIIACDVLVIGGGLAAAAAIKYALEKNINVCQVVKGSEVRRATVSNRARHPNPTAVLPMF